MLPGGATREHLARSAVRCRGEDTRRRAEWARAGPA